MRHTSSALALACALTLLAGCASGIPLHQSDQEIRERYAAYEGPPIKQFTWLGHFYSWEALGKDELVVFTTPSDAYYLKVWPPCDLRFAMNGRGDERISVTSTAGTVSSGLDSVTENSAALGHLVCPISEIRPIDYRRMMADQRQQAQAAKAAQANSPAKP
jgi:Family of unknown function (DUF6491)